MSLTEREKEILAILKKDPLKAQKNIAEQLGIKRSSVAVHITNLANKGYILGKGYIFNDNKQRHIIVIGAANIDITGIANSQLNLNDSNIGKLKLGAGGVGRNIADNFARLTLGQEFQTYLLTAIGDDLHGKLVIQASEEAGIDLSHALVVKDQATASYLSIIDQNGEMCTAINDMSIIDEIRVDYLQSKKHLINATELIIFDTNLNQDVIDYIVENFSHIPIFVDSVSSIKAAKVKDCLNSIHTMTPNLIEAENLSKLSIKNGATLADIANYFHHQGVTNIYITLGNKGIYASNMQNGMINANIQPALKANIVNTNGAGDAFMSGLAFGYIQKTSNEKQLKFACACAAITIESEQTINPNLSAKLAEKYMEKPL